MTGIVGSGCTQRSRSMPHQGSAVPQSSAPWDTLGIWCEEFSIQPLFILQSKCCTGHAKGLLPSLHSWTVAHCWNPNSPFSSGFCGLACKRWDQPGLYPGRGKENLSGMEKTENGCLVGGITLQWTCRMQVHLKKKVFSQQWEKSALFTLSIHTASVGTALS